MLFNIRRAVDYMQRSRLDAIIATSPTNVTYFSNYHSWTDYLFKEYMLSPGASSDRIQNYSMFPLEGDPSLVLSSFEAVNAADVWVEDIHVFGDSGCDLSSTSRIIPENLDRFYQYVTQPQSSHTATDALVELLKTRGLSGARIGIEMEDFPSVTQDIISDALPSAMLLDCTNLIRQVRMVKSADEISLLRQSAEINEQCAMESLNIARPGLSVGDIVSHYRKRIGECGADFDHFAFGMRGLGMFTEADYKLQEDDIMFVDFGCIYKHYFSDSGTTLTMKELPDSVQKKYIALSECINNGQAAANSGKSASSVRDAMFHALSAHGVTASFPHGHGLGLEVRDYPILVSNNGLRIQDDCVDISSDIIIEVDMVINLEASISCPGAYSLHREQSFLVTPKGSESLVSQERESPFRPNSGR